MINRILKLICLMIIFSQQAFAEEKIATVEEGEPAPFAGTLFNTEAAANLIGELEYSDDLCSLRCDERLRLQKTELQFEIDKLQISYNILSVEYEQILEIKNDQIDFLQTQIQKPRFPYEGVFIAGVISGVGLTLAAAYSLNQVSVN